MSARPELQASLDFLASAFREGDSIVGTPAAESARAYVEGNERLTPAEQVDIYRRQYWLRHVGSLLEDHPGIVALLGDDEADTFFRGYLAAHPPVTPSLRDLGRDLAIFADDYDFDGGNGGAVREMVRYELGFVELFDAKEPAPLDPKKLTSVPEDGWDRARIVISPLLARFRFAWPVHRVRLAAREKKTFELPSAPSETRVVLYRKDLQMHFEELDEDGFLLLEALAGGASLVEACDELARGRDDAAQASLQARVGEWFRDWTAWKWIIDVETR